MKSRWWRDTLKIRCNPLSLSRHISWPIITYTQRAQHGTQLSTSLHHHHHHHPSILFVHSMQSVYFRLSTNKWHVSHIFMTLFLNSVIKTGWKWAEEWVMRERPHKLPINKLWRVLQTFFISLTLPSKLSSCSLFWGRF